MPTAAAMNVPTRQNVNPPGLLRSNAGPSIARIVGLPDS